jgi:hypothetical protein
MMTENPLLRGDDGSLTLASCVCGPGWECLTGPSPAWSLLRREWLAVYFASGRVVNYVLEPARLGWLRKPVMDDD